MTPLLALFDHPFSFRWCNEGAHEEQAGAMVDHIRRTEKLAGWLRAQA